VTDKLLHNLHILLSRSLSICQYGISTAVIIWIIILCL